MKRIIGTIIGVLLVEVGIALAVILTGKYDVSALNQDRGLTRWVLSHTMDNSVRRHAQGIEVLPSTDSSMIKIGFSHYHRMCETCHGGPSIPRSEIGEGLNPPPPRLVRAALDWSDAELYWIIKNGVKMTGMPAFGPTHSENELWAIVAFVKHLPTMQPEQYQNMIRSGVPEE